MTYYDNDAAKANEMCEADAYNLLGFVYRKKQGPNFVRSENYYLLYSLSLAIAVHEVISANFTCRLQI